MDSPETVFSHSIKAAIGNKLRKTSVFKAYDFNATEDGLSCSGVAPQYIKSGH